MDKGAARDYLASLLNKNLQITVTDGRVFVGEFKCTDPDMNIVLSNTYEHRASSSHQAPAANAAEAALQSSGTPAVTSRYLGLVVVPGHHVAGLSAVEFASQLRARPLYI
jgi:small nuclear ribonucleoprotein (snRNP)-like protein